VGVLRQERLIVIAGPSQRLRQEVLQPLLDAWSGERQVYRKAPDMAMLLGDLDSASLFGPGVQHIVQVDESWVRGGKTSWLSQHRTELEGQAGSVQAGQLIFLTEKPEKTLRFAKQLLERDAFVDVSPPRRDKDFVDWLRSRLSSGTAVVRDSGSCAWALKEARGMDVDAVLMAWELVQIYADDQPIDAGMVSKVLTGAAEKPPWEVVRAVLDGNPQKALDLMHRQGCNPHAVVSMLHGELRKLTAAARESDPDRLATLLGQRISPRAVPMLRRQAEGLGRRVLERLLRGVILTQRELRQNHVQEADALLETLLIRCQQVIRGT
jgi:DNA polymerase III delta subunit